MSWCCFLTHLKLFLIPNAGKGKFANSLCVSTCFILGSSFLPQSKDVWVGEAEFLNGLSCGCVGECVPFDGLVPFKGFPCLVSHGTNSRFNWTLLD